MKGKFILLWLMLAMAFTISAEEKSVFIKIDRKDDSSKHTQVDRAPMRLPLDVVYDTDNFTITVSGDDSLEADVSLADESGNVLEFSSSINTTLSIPDGYNGIIVIRIESADWIGIGKIEV